VGFVSMEKKLIFFSLVFFFSLPSFSQKMYNQNRDRLEKIKSEIEKKNKEIETYMEKYEKILQEMKKLKESEKNFIQKKEKLTKTLEAIKNDIDKNRKIYNILNDTYKNLINEFNNDIASLYLSGFSELYFYGTNELITGIIKRNMIIYKSDYAKTIEKKVKNISQSITNLSQKKENYIKEINTTIKEYEKNKRSMQLTQKELISTDKKLSELKREIDELNRTANNLTTLIKKIEKTSPYRKEEKVSLNLEKKSLPWPVEGVIVKGFGKEYVSELKTYLVNDGIKIKPSSDKNVRPVMSGSVVYSGQFKGFGKIVIIDHGENLFSTYGFLNDIYVSNGVYVTTSTVIGSVGFDERDRKKQEVLYFELRRGDIPLNPVEWLR
jgi:septal ring factor EnvC (AmiA/AmiB activator)